MMYFQKRRPKGFHHTFIYIDEHHEEVEKITRRARQELDAKSVDRVDEQAFRGMFRQQVSEQRAAHRDTMGVVVRFVLPLLLILLMVVLLVYWG